MTKLFENILKNYIDIFLKAIPSMLSDTTPPKKALIYCALCLFYPLALLVLLALALVVVFFVEPVFLDNKNGAEQ